MIQYIMGEGHYGASGASRTTSWYLKADDDDDKNEKEPQSLMK